jgi:glutathione S-transferase
VYEKTVADMEQQLNKTAWLACDSYTLADAEITPYIERADRLGLAGLWDNRPRVADWFERIKARPSFVAISDFPPTDYDDTGRDGLKDWPRIKQLIAA